MAQSRYSSSLNGDLQKGRQLVMHDCYNELSDDGKAQVDALCCWMVEWTKGQNPHAYFTRESALELIFSYLIHEDDPHGKYDQYRLDKYDERIQQHKLLLALEKAMQDEEQHAEVQNELAA